VPVHFSYFKKYYNAGTSYNIFISLHLCKKSVMHEFMLAEE